MRAFIQVLVSLSILIFPSVATARNQAMIDAINQVRQENGKQQVHWNQALNGASFVHAQGMADGGYCDHGGLWQRLESHGWSGGAYGEMVSCGIDYHWHSVDNWMRSSSHRAILLDGQYNRVGIAHYFGYHGHRWAVILGRQ